MAQQKRRNPVQRQQRPWTFSRFLLVIGYGLVIAFLGTLFLMRQELMRVGIFGDTSVAPAPPPARPPQALTEPQRPKVAPPPAVTTEVERSAPAVPPHVTTEVQPSRTAPPASAPSAPRPSGEITAEEKKALDDILRSKR